MSKRRFNAITCELRFTKTNPLPYVDKFWQIFHMVKSWNDHMTSILLAFWEICLGESMSIWHIIWKCTGLIFCPQKPHQFGNEYQNACCALSIILFVVESVEGKEHPRQSGPLEFEYLGGKTVGLLLCMIKSYFAIGRYVMIDYGFYVLNGLIKLRKRSIFACDVTKKRRYWPSIVPGTEMEDHFLKVEEREIDAIQATLDDVIYNLWGTKEPNYVMRKMDTGGCLLADDICRDTVIRWKENEEDMVKKFKYKLSFYWHFLYCHAVEDQNSLRHTRP